MDGRTDGFESGEHRADSAQTRGRGRQGAGLRTWAKEGRGGGELQASQMKHCRDRGPTSEMMNSGRDTRAMARTSSSPRLCFPQLLLVIAAVIVNLPVAACAGSSDDAVQNTISSRAPSSEAQKELLGQGGAPSQRRGFTVGQTSPNPSLVVLSHALIMIIDAVSTPATRHHADAELRLWS